MTHERLQQVKEIFHSALDLAPERRAAFLIEACDGHDSLRREVESLISSHEQPGHFIDAPAFQAAAEMLADGQEFKPGETLGHYQIRSVLGEGGMGKVYLAEDTKLRRNVALKFVPGARNGNEDGRRRLLREAQAAAALDHPNICAIYEVGEADDQRYIAMQYIEGETLEARMAKGKLSPEDSMIVASQVADALAEAHAHNIVHRDIKPSNVMLTSRGQVKVLDFGLAKTASTASVKPDEAETRRILTTPGMILGTVPYMSPEQLRGQPVDARSDIFSFGVVLYEMLTGQAAFQRNTDAETIGAILHEHPPELSSIDPRMPSALVRVVNGCLAKDAGERYQTMEQVARDLNAARSGELVAVNTVAARTGQAEVDSASHRETAFTDTGRARPTSSIEYLVSEVKHHRRSALLAMAGVIIAVAALGYYFYFARGSEAIDSVAVLPFVNVGNDADTEYLSDGLSDSIINSLSQLPSLKRVISLTSAMRYKGQQVDPRTVGRELNVRAVLIGKLTLRGDDLLISAELVDVKDNKRLWGDQYNRKLADVVRLQGEIAQEIAGGLRLKVSSEQKERLAKHYTESTDAYRAYLKGRFFLEKRTGPTTEKSIEYLKEAIRLDPSYGLAYATLANCYLSFQEGGSLPNEAKQAVAKALEIDDTLAEAQAALGNIRLIEGDWSAAERAFIRARELNPNYQRFHLDYAHYLRLMKRFEEAVAESKRVLDIDPLSVLYNRNVVLALYFARRYDEAIEQSRKTLELEPGMPTAHRWLAKSYEQKGLYDQAVEAWLKTGQFTVHGPEAGAALREAYAASGWKGFWRKALDLKKARTKQMNVDLYSLAESYARLRDKDHAFAWLQKAYEQNDRSPLMWLNCDPFWDDLRSDPRYADLVQRMGLEP